MSNLSELLPSGGGQNVVEFTASGAVASGKPVILNSDGTVTEVSETTISSNVGAETVFDIGAYNHKNIAYDSVNNKILVVYRDGDGSNYGTAVVGTISGTSISFGTPVVFESASTISLSVDFDPDEGAFLIVYSDLGNGSYGTGIVGTISGTSISFGGASVFYSGTIDIPDITYDAAERNFVISYIQSNNSVYAAAVGANISGTSITYGSSVVFNSNNSDTASMSICYHTVGQRVVIALVNNNTNKYGSYCVGNLTGTSLSFGSVGQFAIAATNWHSVAYDASADRLVFCYQNTTSSSHGYAIIGELYTPTESVTFPGSAVQFEAAQTEYIDVVYDPTASKTVVIYRDDANSGSGTVRSGTVSSTSITFDSPDIFNSGSTVYIKGAYDSSAEKIAIVFSDNANSAYGTSLVYTTGYIGTNLTAASFIGLAADAISDTASGNINVKGGINEAQTGLTIGSDYYVQSDGTLGTTADTPSVKVGQAISATTINMMDLT